MKRQKFRVDGSVIIDTRNKWQKLFDRKYNDILWSYDPDKEKIKQMQERQNGANGNR